MSADRNDWGHVHHNLGVNPTVAHEANRRPLEFHRKLPGYSPTPLVAADSIARRLGVGSVLIKDESDRFGLPSFKILGSSWACYRAVLDRLGREPDPWTTLEALAAQLGELRPLTFVAATDGNHGRAVAWMARQLGFEARIFVPSGTADARVQAISGEDATVVVVDGSYDDAIERAADQVDDHCVVISDTSWPGYERIPHWVSEGYTTLFWEIEDDLASRGGAGLDAIVVPIGVGSLASAAVMWSESTSPHNPLVIGVEPADVPSMTRSVETGHRIAIPGPHRTVMSGLRCGTPSLIAYPIVESGVEWFVTVDDAQAISAMQLLADVGVVSGETGAAALAGVIEALASPNTALRDQLAPLSDSTIVVLSTEGATDPANYDAVVDRPPRSA